jgi:hypothetical protein
MVFQLAIRATRHIFGFRVRFAAQTLVPVPNHSDRHRTSLFSRFLFTVTEWPVDEKKG